MPPVLDKARTHGLVVVSLLVLLQGGAMAGAAFATRSLFEAMHTGGGLPTPMLGVLVLCGFITALARILARRQGEQLGQDYARDLRNALFEHAARMPARAVAERRAGFMSLRFVGDMTAFRNWLALGLPRLISALIMVPCALLALTLMAPILAYVVVPILLSGGAAVLLAGLRLLPLHDELRRRRAVIAAEMTERMPMAPQLDILGRRTRETKRMNRQIATMIEVALRRITWAESLKAVPDLMAGAAAATVIAFGFRAQLSPGTIAGALAALGLLLQPMRDLGSVWNLRAAHRVARAKANAALKRSLRPQPEARRGLPKGALQLSLDAVPLPSGAQISRSFLRGRVQEVSVDTADFAALCDMIQRLDAPASGVITLGGRPLQEIAPGSLRRRVGRIDASAPVLQGSLRRALSLGLEDRPSDAQLLTLAESCALGPLLSRLGGLDGRIAEGGRNLSVREHTLIALVRVHLRKPGLVLIGSEIRTLDTATLRDLRIYLETGEFTVLSALPLNDGSIDQMGAGEADSG